MIALFVNERERERERGGGGTEERNDDYGSIVTSRMAFNQTLILASTISPMSRRWSGEVRRRGRAGCRRFYIVIAETCPRGCFNHARIVDRIICPARRVCLRSVPSNGKSVHYAAANVSLPLKFTAGGFDRRPEERDKMWNAPLVRTLENWSDFGAET